jgi:hypothetical protein
MSAPVDSAAGVEILYGVIAFLYLGHAAFQKRQFKKLEESADECIKDRELIRKDASDERVRVGKAIGSLEKAVQILSTPCKTLGCERNDIITEATSLQPSRPARTMRRH